MELHVWLDGDNGGSEESFVTLSQLGGQLVKDYAYLYELGFEVVEVGSDSNATAGHTADNVQLNIWLVNSQDSDDGDYATLSRLAVDLEQQWGSTLLKYDVYDEFSKEVA